MFNFPGSGMAHVGMFGFLPRLSAVLRAMLSDPGGSWFLTLKLLVLGGVPATIGWWDYRQESTPKTPTPGFYGSPITTSTTSLPISDKRSNRFIVQFSAGPNVELLTEMDCTEIPELISNEVMGLPVLSGFLEIWISGLPPNLFLQLDLRRGRWPVLKCFI